MATLWVEVAIPAWFCPHQITPLPLRHCRHRQLSICLACTLGSGVWYDNRTSPGISGVVSPSLGWILLVPLIIAPSLLLEDFRRKGERPIITTAGVVTLLKQSLFFAFCESSLQLLLLLFCQPNLGRLKLLANLHGSFICKRPSRFIFSGAIAPLEKRNSSRFGRTTPEGDTSTAYVSSTRNMKGIPFKIEAHRHFRLPKRIYRSHDRGLTISTNARYSMKHHHERHRQRQNDESYLLRFNQRKPRLLIPEDLLCLGPFRWSLRGLQRGPTPLSSGQQNPSGSSAFPICRFRANADAFVEISPNTTRINVGRTERDCEKRGACRSLRPRNVRRLVARLSAVSASPFHAKWPQSYTSLWLGSVLFRAGLDNTSVALRLEVGDLYGGRQKQGDETATRGRVDLTLRTFGLGFDARCWKWPLQSVVHMVPQQKASNPGLPVTAIIRPTSWRVCRPCNAAQLAWPALFFAWFW